MAMPMERQLRVPAAPSGQSTVVKLGAHARGELCRFIVKQATGSLDGFTVDLFSSKNAANAHSGAQSAGPDQLQAEVYKIIPTQTVAAAAAEASLYNGAWPYENQDTRNAIPNPAIYLVITPSGSGNKDFDVGYAVYGPPLN